MRLGVLKLSLPLGVQAVMQSILDRHRETETLPQGATGCKMEVSETDGGVATDSPMLATLTGGTILPQSGLNSSHEDDDQMDIDEANNTEIGNTLTKIKSGVKNLNKKPIALDGKLLQKTTADNLTDTDVNTQPCLSETDSFTSEAILVDSRPASAISQTSNVSSLQAFSSGSSGDNSLNCTDNEDSGEQSTSVTTPPAGALLSPPKIVITDFSFDEPTDVQVLDPFEGVEQSTSVGTQMFE